MLNRLICWMFNHKLSVIQIFNLQGSERLRCSRCKRDFAVNHSVRAFLEWDKEFEDMYRFMGEKIIDPWYPPEEDDGRNHETHGEGNNKKGSLAPKR